jgi:PAS domain S-box-containing protein
MMDDQQHHLSSPQERAKTPEAYQAEIDMLSQALAEERKRRETLHAILFERDSQQQGEQETNATTNSLGFSTALDFSTILQNLHHEIAERRQIEQTLRESEERYRFLVEHSVQGLTIHQDGRPVFANQASAHICGYTVEELTSMSSEEAANIIHPDDRDMVIQRGIERQAGKEIEPSYTIRIVRKDGTIRHIEIYATRTQFEGRPAVQMTYVDVTEREELLDALRRQQSLLQDIIDNMPSLILVKDANERIVLANKRFLQTFQVSIGQELRDCMHASAEMRARWRKEDAKVLATGTPLQSKETIPRPDGTTRTCLVNKFLLTNHRNSEDGHREENLLGTVCTDITELMHTQEAYRNLVEHTLQGLIIYQDGRHVFTNSTAAAITGYSVEEITDHLTLEKLVHPEDCELVMSCRNARLACHKDVPTHYEHRIIRKDGQIRWVEVYAMVIQYRGSPATQVSFTDITQRKQAEEENQSNLQLLQTLLDTIPSPIFYQDVQNVFLDCNNAFAKQIIGLSKEDIIRRQMEDFLHTIPKSEQQSWRRRTREYLASPKPVTHEIQVICADQVMRNFIITKTPFPKSNKEVGGIIGVMTDITERKQFEETLERRVVERTTQLFSVINELQEEIGQRERMNEILEYQAHLIDSISDAIISSDIHGIIQSWNNAAQTIYGWSTREAVGQPVTALLKTSYPSTTPQEVHEYILAEGQWEGEVVEERKDGKLVNILSSTTLICDRNGVPTGMVALNRDITNRKQSEQALIESEERYRILVETSPSAILVTGLDNTIHFCNQQAAHLFGYDSVNDLLGHSSAELVATGIDPLTHMQTVIEAGFIRNMEYTMRRKDGKEFPAEVSSSVIMNTQNKPSALVIVVHDISERKQGEWDLTAANDRLFTMHESVSRNRNLLRAIFDGLEDGLLLLDGDGVVQAVNKAFANLLNLTEEQLVGNTWEHVCQGLESPFPIDPMKEMYQGEDVQKHRIRYCHPNGTTSILELQMISLCGSDNLVDRIILHVVDLTETLQLEARVLENERFAASGKLAASVAHEINTPLQSIELFLDMAQSATSNEERETFLRQAREETQWVGQIVMQLLNLYRPSASMPGWLEINNLIERIVLLIGKRLHEQGVVVESHLAEDLPMLWGRANELMQVLINLMVNALDAMQDGGNLTVSTDIKQNKDEEWVLITIEDTGSGIPKEIINRIFEPFVTTRDNGTGLGLAISNQIVKQYQGKIHVKSRVGRGSSFTVSLPVTVETEEEPAPESYGLIHQQER